MEMWILFTTILIGFTTGKEVCPRNSMWTDDTCYSKCSEIGMKKECQDNLVPGCKCTMPHNFMTESGKCVHRFACPDNEVICPENKTYHTCGDCPKTCQQMYQWTSCSNECQTGCQCSENFYSTKSGDCVEAKDCPQEEIECLPGLEIKYSDGILKTCKNYLTVNDSDSEISIPTCGCPNADEVYDVESKKCVPKDDCEDLINGRTCKRLYCKPLECQSHLCSMECFWECICNKGYSYSKDSEKCEIIEEKDSQ